MSPKVRRLVPVSRRDRIALIVVATVMAVLVVLSRSFAIAVLAGLWLAMLWVSMLSAEAAYLCGYVRGRCDVIASMPQPSGSEGIRIQRWSDWMAGEAMEAANFDEVARLRERDARLRDRKPVPPV